MQFERKIISLSLDVSMFKELEKVGKEKKKSTQEIIRGILEGYLEIREINSAARDKRKNNDSE